MVVWIVLCMCLMWRKRKKEGRPMAYIPKRQSTLCSGSLFSGCSFCISCHSMASALTLVTKRSPHPQCFSNFNTGRHSAALFRQSRRNNVQREGSLRLAQETNRPTKGMGHG